MMFIFELNIEAQYNVLVANKQQLSCRPRKIFKCMIEKLQFNLHNSEFKHLIGHLYPLILAILQLPIQRSKKNLSDSI